VRAKPHLRVFYAGQWCCHIDFGWPVGYGRSPDEAYADWLDKRFSK